MPININLFGHILLDAELHGRFGVQGNTFANTFHYFLDYFNSKFVEPDDTINPTNYYKIRELNLIIHQLLEYESDIQRLNTSTSKATDFNEFISQITDKIIALAPTTQDKPEQLYAMAAAKNMSQQLVQAHINKLTQRQSSRFDFWSERTKKKLTAARQLLHDVKDHKITQASELSAELKQNKTLMSLVQKINEYKDLPPPSIDSGKTLLLPGGWDGREAGHALLYEFKKNASGALLFSIYNSGAGIEFHEKHSEVDQQHSFPIKTYKIPAPTNPAELRTLVAKLIKPRTLQHPLHNAKPIIYDATRIYHGFEASMPFLHAEPVLVSESTTHSITTAGQISGTCSQRSIHQMLKVNFDTTPHYQSFIFDFKMHALQEFIAEHPIPRSIQINQMIQLAIENNLKILQEPGLFASEIKKNQHADILIAMKQILADPLASRPQEINSTVSSMASAYEYTMEPRKIVAQQVFSEKDHGLYPIHPDLSIEPGKLCLVAQMKHLLEYCGQQNIKDPRWVLQKIESIMIHLPLPHEDSMSHAASLLPFYAETQDLGQLEELMHLLDALREVYQITVVRLMNVNTVPTTLITHASFMAIYDYLNILNAQSKGLPSAHDPISSIISTFVSGLKYSPHIASHHPAYDLRFKQLLELYPKNTSGQSIQQYYQDLLNSEPVLKPMILEAYYKLDGEKISEKKERALEQHDALDLYALCSLIDERGHLRTPSTINHEKFQPLAHKLNQALCMEQFFVKNANILFQSKARPTIQLAFEFDEREPTIKFHSAITDGSFSWAHQKDSSSYLFKLQYNIKVLRDSAPTVHMNKLRTSNAIQVEEADLISRDLYHLRTIQNSQIQLTLDYFISSIELFANPDIQRYVEANLMEPGLLCSMLQADRDAFFRSFDALISQGLRHYVDQQGKITEASCYFLQLSTSVNGYVAEYVPETDSIVQSRLIHDQALINQAIESTQNAALLLRLHRTRFINWLTQHHSPGESITLNQLREGLTSHFYLKSKSTSMVPLEIIAGYELQQAERQLADILRIYNERAPDVLKQAIQQVACACLHRDDPIYQVTMTGTYPTYILTDNGNGAKVTVQAQTGEIFNEHNLRHSEIPLALRNHPTLKKLQLNEETMCFISMNELTIEWLDGTVKLIRQNIHSDALQSIQKKWSINSTTAWYEHHAETTYPSKLPTYLMDACADYWENDTDAFITQNNQPKFYLSQYVIPNTNRFMPKYRGLEQLDAMSQANGELLSSATIPLIHGFESPEFIQVTQKQTDQTQYSVFLPRYGLSFHQNHDTLRLDKTPFCVKKGLSSAFKSSVAQITLHDDQNNQQCIIPIQRFYVQSESETNQTPGHEYQFTHDITAVIAKASVKHVRGLKWIYLNSEKFITYAMVDGVPQPSNAAEALYLAYIYLATHETETAKVILTDLSQRFPLTGNAQELAYLSWIVNDLPCQRPNPIVEASVNSANVNACQLKALALLTDFLAEGKKPEITSMQDSDQTHLNGLYATINQQEVQSFYDRLNHTIEDRYSKFINKLRAHIHESFALSDAESNSLLHYYYSHLPNNSAPTPSGTLGYESRSLTLKNLLREKNTLESMQLAGQTLTGGLNKRLVELNHKLTTEVNIMGQRTILEESTVDLSLNPQNRLYFSDSVYTAPPGKQALSALSIRIPSYEELSIEEYPAAMMALSSNISEEDFDLNMKFYLDIALTKTACGFVQLSIDPLSIDFPNVLKAIQAITFNHPRIQSLVTSRIIDLDTIIAFQSKLYYLDQSTQKVSQIIIPSTQAWGDALERQCMSEYSFFATHDLLTEIFTRTGHTPINYPLLNYRDQLRDFCVKYITGHRHTTLVKQDTNIPYLTTILYLAIESGKKFETRYHNIQKKNDCSANLQILVDSLDAKEVTPITVLEPKNVFTKLLATTKDILLKLRERSPQSWRIRTISSDDARYNLANQLNLPLSLTQALDHYQSAENAYQAVFSDAQQTPDQRELDVGESLYACLKCQREISVTALQSTTIRDQLRAAAIQRHDVLADQIHLAWDDILLQANTLMVTRFRIQVSAGQKHHLVQQDLRTAYFHADTAKYIESTGLSSEAVTILHEQIHACMLLEVEKQHAIRLQKAIDQIDPEKPDPIKLAKILTTMTGQNLPDAAQDPAIMLFQYEEDILLRPRQLQAIKNLLSSPDDPHHFNASIEKVIMGGGKSKVILPLLAQKKANGTNLVVMEVPRPLLATNYIDLFQTSQRLFGQKAFCFEFDRDNDCSPQRLEEIYERFCDISAHKNYLVTTGESMQSLELKTLELLRAGPEQEDATQAGQKTNRSIWEEQVYWASKIIELLKQRGDVVIDEVHQGLLLKKKLNYTLGEPKPIDQTIIDHAVNLYLFINTLDAGKKTASTLSERVKNEWAELDMGHVLHQLLTHTESPLKQSLSTLYTIFNEETLTDELRDYFNNQKEPFFLHNLAPELKNTLAFYKEELRLLPQTLNRQYKVQYGPSKLSNKSTEYRSLAIPYSANDKPNERSRFGNALETLNYSIQSLLILGLNAELVKNMFIQWQAEARFEFLNGEYLDLNDTPTAKKIATDLTGNAYGTLAEIDTNNTEKMAELVLSISQNPVFLAHALRHHILPKITTEPAILHSDAYNHVSLYRSTQGLSGTPSNHSTFHQRLSFNPYTSLGSDGYIQSLIKHKETAIHQLDFNQLNIYLPRLLQPTSVGENVRAIIDISATFAGISNLEVTHALAVFYAENNPTIKHILYFNEEDVLCAYSIQQKNTLVLASSSPEGINQQLQSTPNERFTYYDQSHTVGTDLKQAPFASALCLIDEKTQSQHFLQGAMRMRELSENQSIQMVIPSSMLGQSLEAMLDIMRQNENAQILNDNFYATMAKLKNVIRDRALQLIASIDDRDIETKQHYVRIFDGYFVEQRQEDLFAEYGSICTIQPVEQLFQQQIARLIQQWTQDIGELRGEVATTEEQESLLSELNEISQAALKHCPEKVNSPLHNNAGTEVEVQKELEKEQAMQQEIQQIAEKAIQTRCISARYLPWTSGSFEQFILTGSLPVPTRNWWSLNASMFELNSACDSWTKEHKLFDPKIMMTTNYSETLMSSGYSQAQTKTINSHLKPIHIVLFRLDDNGLSSFLVSNQEADDFITLLNRSDIEAPPHVWLSTSQHTNLAGNQPNDLLLREDYHTHLEQIRYFNGNLVELLEQPTPYFWLTQDHLAKLDFFKKEIMPYRKTTSSQLIRLNSLLATMPASGFDYMAAHAFTDLTSFAWTEKYPQALPPEIATLTNLAQALHHSNQTFCVLAEHPTPYMPILLSAQAKEFYAEHQNKLSDIKLLLKQIESTSDEKKALETITAEELVLLQNFLDVNLTLIKSAHNTESFNLELLMLLVQSPYIGDKKALEAMIRSSPLLQDPASHVGLLENKSDNILRALLLYAKPEDDTLQAIVTQTQNQTTLALALEQSNLPDQMFKELIDKPQFTDELLHTLVDQKLPEQRIIILLDKLQSSSSLPPLEHAILCIQFIMQLNYASLDPKYTEQMSRANCILCDAINTDPHADQIAAKLISDYPEHKDALQALVLAIAAGPKTTVMYQQLLINISSTPPELRNYIVTGCSTEKEAMIILEHWAGELTSQEHQHLLAYVSNHADIHMIIPAILDRETCETLLARSTEIQTIETLLQTLEQSTESAAMIQEKNQWAERACCATQYVDFKKIIDAADKINAFSDTVLMDKLFNNPALPQSLCEMLQSKLDTYQTASTGQKNSEFKRNVASAMEPSVSLLDAEDGGKQAGPGQT